MRVRKTESATTATTTTTETQECGSDVDTGDRMPSPSPPIEKSKKSKVHKSIQWVSTRTFFHCWDFKNFDWKRSNIGMFWVLFLISFSQIITTLLKLLACMKVTGENGTEQRLLYAVCLKSLIL